MLWAIEYPYDAHGVSKMLLAAPASTTKRQGRLVHVSSEGCRRDIPRRFRLSRIGGLEHRCFYCSIMLLLKDIGVLAIVREGTWIQISGLQGQSGWRIP